MHPTFALYVADDITVCWDGKNLTVPSTPPGSGEDFVVLLARFAGAAEARGLSEITVLLDRGIVTQLGFPAKPPTTLTKAQRHHLMERVRQHHWLIDSMSPWMSFRRTGKPTIHIGIGPWLGKGNFALYQEGLTSSTYLIGRIQELTGTAFRMTPGVVGSAMLQDQWVGEQPYWHPDWTGCDPADDHVTEQAYWQWTPPTAPEGSHLHSYDAHRNYLGAAGVAEVSFDRLYRCPLKDFNRKRAGYWQVVVPAWNEPRMPHPMGPDRHTGQTMWTTTPTMILMEDLAQQGFMDMPTVLDSWLSPEILRPRNGRKAGPAVRRILRAWSERIDRAADEAAHDPNPEDAELLEKVSKLLYKEALGMWVTGKGRITRADWAHTALSKARTNTWRKVWGVAQMTGVYPARIHVDEITYASNVSDPYDAIPRTSGGTIPANFRVTPEGTRPKLGMFKIPKTAEA